jgi:hypothetical protein
MTTILPADLVHRHFFPLAQQVSRGELTPEQAIDKLVELWMVSEIALEERCA